MDYFLVLYFLAGALEDFLVTLNWRYVAKEKPFSAAFFSFLATVVNMAVVYNILTAFDNTRSILAIIVFSLGISTGTFLAMKFNPDFKAIFSTKRRTKKVVQTASATSGQTSLIAPIHGKTVIS